jgi:hypothetical protein
MLSIYVFFFAKKPVFFPACLITTKYANMRIFYRSEKRSKKEKTITAGNKKPAYREG